MMMMMRDQDSEIDQWPNVQRKKERKKDRCFHKIKKGNHIHTYIPTDIHTYIHTYIPTDIHTYIHTIRTYHTYNPCGDGTKERKERSNLLGTIDRKDGPF